MAAKKRSATGDDKQLKKTVKELRAQLKRADAKADKWKTKADKLQKSAAESDAKVKKLTKRLDKASRTAKQPSAVESSSPTVAPIPAVGAETGDVPDAPATEAAATEATETDAVADVETTDGPDDSWTVVQLRAEARSRGLTGLSGKSKAQLLVALS